MAGTEGGPPAVRGYLVFHEIEPGVWHLVGDVDHRPGLAARAERARAVRDATGADPASGSYAALPRDQWHVVHGG